MQLKTVQSSAQPAKQVPVGVNSNKLISRFDSNLLIYFAGHLDLDVWNRFPETNRINIDSLVNKVIHLLLAYLGTAGKVLGHIFWQNNSSGDEKEYVQIKGSVKRPTEKQPIIFSMSPSCWLILIGTASFCVVWEPSWSPYRTFKAEVIDEKSFKSWWTMQYGDHYSF